jgi:hypothetical protein
VVRATGLASLLLIATTTGCFHWAPVSSLGDVEDERVEITRRSEVMVLEHATAHGHVITGQTWEGAQPADVDVSEVSVRVRARQLDGVATGIIVGLGVALTTVVVVVLTALVVAASHPVFEDGGSAK